MSFGTSVGDVIAIGTLAWKLYMRCRQSSDDFKNLSDSVASLHVALRETEVYLVEQGSGASASKERLAVVTNGCEKVLKALESVLDKYESLGTRSQRAWDRLRFGLKDIECLREQLRGNALLITTFNTSLMKSVIIRSDESSC